MKKKMIIVISSRDECQHSKKQYYGSELNWRFVCKKSNNKIIMDSRDVNSFSFFDAIPNWCPLENAE